jgi:hypothetical protein
MKTFEVIVSVVLEVGFEVKAENRDEAIKSVDVDGAASDIETKLYRSNGRVVRTFAPKARLME